MSAYAVYRDTSVADQGANVRVIERIYRTQALATAAAAADAALSVYRGALPDASDVGALFDSGTGALVERAAPSANTARKRAAARRVHAALQGWSAALAAEGVVHPASVVGVGHDFLFRAHQAVWLMAHRDLLPLAQFEAWTVEMAMGAADVTSPRQFFARMEAGGGIAAPTGPCAWVRWGHTQSEGFTTAIRVNLADAVAASGAVTVQAPGNLALDAADLPQGGLAADGSWIDSLAA